METEVSKRKNVTQGRKAGGRNRPRTYDYSIHAEGWGRIVSVPAQSPEEAEKKGKGFCSQFGYTYSHVVKGDVPHPGRRSSMSSSAG
jgi:hypothetical protein